MMVSTAELKPVTLGLYGMMSYFTPRVSAVMLGAPGCLPLIAYSFTGRSTGNRAWLLALAGEGIERQGMEGIGFMGAIEP